MRTDRKTPAPDPRTERMLSYLDGAMNAAERDAYETELAANPDYAREVEGHRALLATLDEMAAYAPSSDFRVRVLAFLETPESWWVRLWRRVAGTSRPVSNVFTAFLDEGLTARQAKALVALVASDPEAAAAMAGWKRLFGELESLPVLQPSEGFADRVMARVVAPERQQVARPRAAPTPGRGLARIPGLAAASRFGELAIAWIDARWPTPRDRFAVTSGMAVGPVAVLLATLHMLSGNPLLTTSNVASFLRTKVGGAVSQVVDTISANPVANAAMGRISGFTDAWAVTTPALAAGVVVFCALTLLSAWILYRNVVKASTSENRYVSV